MLTVFFDAETYYSKEYSLRKMTPVEYILDQRFELIGAAVAVDDGEPVWMEGEASIIWLRELNQPYRLVSHNALFDATILAHRYQIYPTLCVDTMSMARALLTAFLPRGSVSLENVARYLGLGEKGKEIANVIGMRLADLQARQTIYIPFQSYAIQDAKLCRGIYNELKPKFPAKEFVINHMVIEMVTRPQFQVDLPKLYQYQYEIEQQKESLLDSIGVAKEDLMSNEKFATLLEQFGVEPPTKISVTTGKETWAFAKNDPGFAALEEHDDPRVQMLIAARVGHKSTIEETRTQRFIDVANATRDSNGDSWFPVPLRFSGAHTHRFSGDWKLNCQNLKRGGTLRKSLKSPTEHLVATVDASQIEARLTALLCGQMDLVAQFRDGEDVYSLFATEAYGYVVIKKTHPNERHVGKRCILGLGFGAGGKVLNQAIFADNRDFGLGIEMDIIRATELVKIFRNKYRHIAATWNWLNEMLPYIASGEAEGHKWGPVTFEKEAILLPTGMRLFYHNLRYQDRNWSYQFGRERKRIYGGKILENCVQALDRAFVMEAAINITKRSKRELGWDARLAHQVHDELVYVVPANLWEPFQKIMAEEMARPPIWMPELPVASETGSGVNYGEAK